MTREHLMKLWQLSPVDDWEPWHDKAFGFVVRAETEDQARALANEMGGNEGSAWLDRDLTYCDLLTNEGRPQIIIRDFAAS